MKQPFLGTLSFAWEMGVDEKFLYWSGLEEFHRRQLFYEGFSLEKMGEGGLQKRREHIRLDFKELFEEKHCF